MSSERLRNWTARSAVPLLGAAAIGLAIAAPAQAEPLWPGGPDIGTPAIIPPPPPAPVFAPCGTQARACMRLSTNEAWLMDNGRVTYGPTPVSFGRPGYETPPGVFKVAFKKIYHWSTMHNAEMRFAVFFNGDIATHIGPIEEQSHGCVRMVPEGAEALYNHVEPGDIIEVVN